MRGPLIEQKQKAQSAGDGDPGDYEKHIRTAKDKALYLLKFAGEYLSNYSRPVGSIS